MQASAEDKELLKQFEKNRAQDTYKLIGIRFVIMFVLAILFTIFIYVITGKLTVDTIRNIVPFYILFAVFTAIVVLGMLIKTIIISGRVKKAFNSGYGITVSEHIFNLYNIDHEHVSVGDDVQDSTFYDFCSDGEKGIKFSVGSNQVGCCFDKAEAGKWYKIFCILDKSIFFISIK